MNFQPDLANDWCADNLLWPTMVGRVYRWQGELWRVLVRWRDAGRAGDPCSADCEECGSIRFPAIDPARGHVPHCQCAGATANGSMHNPGRRQQGMAPRNVLIENIATGERTVRPFRGLRLS